MTPTTPGRRSAIVTAAAGGIGLATVRLLAAQGVQLSLVDSNEARLGECADELRAVGADVLTHAADVTDAKALEKVVAAHCDAFARIDMLVNVAGGSGALNLLDIEDIPLEVWDSVFAVNLRATFALCRLVVPRMRERAYGRIVNTGSMLAFGRHGPVGTAGARLAYAAAKAGLLGFTAQLAKDVGSAGITVNTVLPGWTLGDAGSRMRERYDALEPAQREALTARYPLGRPARAEEVAATIVFLASEQASYVSGQGLAVDGAAW